MSSYVVIFIIFVLIVSIIILIATKKQSVNEGFYAAAPGTKPDKENISTIKPGNVVKVEYFYIPTCPYCIKYDPIFDSSIERLMPDYPKLNVKKYNIREAGNADIMKKSTDGKSNTVPCVVIWYDDGRKLLLNSVQRNHLELYVRYTE